MTMSIKSIECDIELIGIVQTERTTFMCLK